MTYDIDEAVATLKSLQDHFDPANVGGIDPELTITIHQIYEAQEAIDKIKSAKETVKEWSEALDKVDVTGIEKLLEDDSVQVFARFDRDAVYDETFQMIDVGDEEKLAGQQEIAGNAAQDAFEDLAHQADKPLTALHEKIKAAVEALDPLL